MPEIGVDLEIGRDDRGYRVLPAVPGRRPARREALWQGAGRAARIIRAGGRLVRERPLERYPDLYTSFAKLPADAQSLAEWMNGFGPMLPSVDEDDGCSVDVLAKEIADMRGLIEIHQSSPTALLQVTKAHGIHLRDLVAVLTVNPVDDRFLLSMRPKSLIGGMWIQFARDLIKGTRLSTCRHCARIFPAGTGTGRRLDAGFCSKEHQVAFNSLERTRRKSS